MAPAAAPDEQMTAPTDAAAFSTRSLAPDVARGLMLALIAIANVSWLLWGHEGSVGMTPHVPALGPLDTAVQFVMTVAVDHRALPLFAFLFGYGMVQFYRSRIDRGMEPRIVRLMMRRRHWAMLLLGFLHAALLFYGDILGAYAIAALLLVWIFFGRRTRTLVIWASVIGGVLLLYGLFSVVSMLALLFFAPPEVIAEMGASATPFSNDWVRDMAYAQPYLITVLTRSGMWAVTILGAALMATPLPILLGWIAARHRLLDEPWRHTRTLRRIAVLGIPLGWLSGLPDALVLVGAIQLPSAVSWGFYGVNVLGGMLCGVGYAAAFGLLAVHLERRRVDGHGQVTGHDQIAEQNGHAAAPSAATSGSPSREQRKVARAELAAADRALSPAERSYGVTAAAAPPAAAAPHGIVRALAAVGQRSLTLYLFQSLLLVPLMASWGLGLAPHLSTVSAVAVAFAAWLISLPIAAWMDSRGMRGPAELLLRRMTYGKHDPRGRS